MEQEKDIYFYGQTRKHGQFSNFYPCNFKDEDGIQYNCSEQYFMYKKVEMFDPDNKELLNLILKEVTPGKIKAYGGKRYLKKFNNKIWEKERINIMETALYLKFSQNDYLKKYLLDTGSSNLYEASHRDAIWGIGFGVNQALKIPKNEYGKNLLGLLLMKIRQRLLNEQKKPNTIEELLDRKLITKEMYIQLINVLALDDEVINILLNDMNMKILKK